MSRSLAVTRTFSMGSSGTSTRAPVPQDLQNARRHSLVGMRALMWASNNSRSLGWDRVTSKDNILSNVVTPDSIPQFTIPRLAVEDSCSELDRQKSVEDDSDLFWTSSDEPDYSLQVSSSFSSSSSYTGSTSSGFGSSPSLRRKARRSISDPESLLGSLLLQREASRDARRQLYDPASCAALSLPHLAKVTTPYGFVTLSQSPQMASEEALLFQSGLSRRWNKPDEESGAAAQKHIKPELRKSQTAASRSSASPSALLPMQLQVGTVNQRDGDGAPKQDPTPERSALGSSKPRCRLWGVLRKHFISPKKM